MDYLVQSMEYSELRIFELVDLNNDKKAFQYLETFWRTLRTVCFPNGESEIGGLSETRLFSSLFACKFIFDRLLQNVNLTNIVSYAACGLFNFPSTIAAKFSNTVHLLPKIFSFNLTAGSANSTFHLREIDLSSFSLQKKILPRKIEKWKSIPEFSDELIISLEKELQGFIENGKLTIEMSIEFISKFIVSIRPLCSISSIIWKYHIHFSSPDFLNMFNTNFYNFNSFQDVRYFCNTEKRKVKGQWKRKDCMACEHCGEYVRLLYPGDWSVSVDHNRKNLFFLKLSFIGLVLKPEKESFKDNFHIEPYSMDYDILIDFFYYIHNITSIN